MRSNDHLSKLSLLVVSLVAIGACKSPTNAPTSNPAATAPAKISVPEGKRGTVKGRVVFKGDAPTPQSEPLPPTVFKVCGENSVDHSLVLHDGALQFAMIAIDAPWVSDAPTTPPLLDQKKCSYEPEVLGALAGSTISIRNSDPLIHNVRTTAFNVAMPLEGQTVSKKLPATVGAVKVQCDVHPWMRATVYTFTHTYFQATDADGRFVISSVPAGTQTLLLQHPRFPTQRKTVVIPPDGEVEANFEVGF